MPRALIARASAKRPAVFFFFFFFLLQPQWQFFFFLPHPIPLTDLALTPPSLVVRRSWCGECRKLFNSSGSHKCTAFACRYCGKNSRTRDEFNLHFYGPPSNKHAHAECAVCHKLMPPDCLAVHTPKCNGVSVRCTVCNECYTDRDKLPSNPRAITKEQHLARCGMKFRYCDNCACQMPKAHECIITRKSSVHDWNKRVRTCYVFDLECARDTEKAGEQVVTFVSVREVLEPLENENGAHYTARQTAHHDENPPISFTTLHDFCVWAYTRTESVFVAHNLSGYDGVIVHNYFRYTLKVKTKVVNVGLKVMFFKWGSCKMIDSLNHIKCGLDGLPRLVGLSIPGLQKTHFPHEFNTLANRSYEGAMPAADFYEPGLGKECLDVFAAWHTAEALKYTPTTDKVCCTLRLYTLEPLIPPLYGCAQVTQ